MKYFLLIVLSLIVLSVSGQNFIKGLKGATCLASLTPKLSSDCLKDFTDEFDSRPKGEAISKAVCCAYLELQSCVKKISVKDCGEEGESVAMKFMNTIKLIASDDCIDYGYITCNTAIKIVIFASVVLILIGLLSCFCFVPALSCCCSWHFFAQLARCRSMFISSK